MKMKFAIWASAASLAGFLAGCTTPEGQPYHTGTGALVGGASGAALGAVVAHESPGAGAAIGGAAGAVVGGLIGHGMDEQQRAQTPPPGAYYPAPAGTVSAPPPPTLNDIKAMTRAGVSESVIMGQIDNSHAVYTLDANAIIDLQNAGVSPNVITHMINTSQLAAAPAPAPAGNVIVAQAPPPPPPQPVVVAPGPGYVWVDGDWVWNGASWIWMGGHWVLPPYPHAVWIRGGWAHGPRGWYHHGGHWR